MSWHGGMLERAVYDISVWAVTFMPRTVCLIAGAVSSVLSYFAVNFIHSHTGLYEIGLIQSRRWQGVSQTKSPSSSNSGTSAFFRERYGLRWATCTETS